MVLQNAREATIATLRVDIASLVAAHAEVALVRPLHLALCTHGISSVVLMRHDFHAEVAEVVERRSTCLNRVADLPTILRLKLVCSASAPHLINHRLSQLPH